ncbi:MAG: TetR/AcrR family transcriptional regulator [Erysipelotrichaceae bacterium]
MAYKKGIATKETIVNESKKLFYIYGYKMVNISEICRNSNCKLGTFTYYFPKKENLITELYERYLDNCYKHVMKYASIDSKMEMHIYAICFYYHNLFLNENCRNFQQEILSIKSMNEIFADPTNQIRNFLYNSDIDFNSEKFSLITICDHASRRELNLLFMQEGIFTKASIKNLMVKIYTHLSLLSGYDINTITGYIDAAFQFIDNYPDDTVTLLSV